MKQFRILHTESSLGWGGQEMRVFQELMWMRAHGHWVGLAAPARSRIYQRAKGEGIPLFPLEAKGIKMLPAILKMAQIFRELRLDVVNTHSSRDGWVGGLAARLADTPLIIRSRHIEVEYKRGRGLSRIGFGRVPHHVLTTSRRIATQLEEELGVPREMISNLPTGVDITRFHPGVQGTLQAELGLPADMPIIGVASVLRSWKGHAWFLDAAVRVKDAGYRCHFVIAGDGPQRTELAEGIVRYGLQGKLTALGHRDDIPQVLASLTALVLPSIAHEGVPQIILQAQAMAKPVIGTTIGGIPEVIEDGVTGLLAEPKSGAALAEPIMRLLRDPALAATLGVNAHRQILERHTVDVMGRTLEELYARLL